MVYVVLEGYAFKGIIQEYLPILFLCHFTQVPGSSALVHSHFHETSRRCGRGHSAHFSYDPTLYLGGQGIGIIFPHVFVVSAHDILYNICILFSLGIRR